MKQKVCAAEVGQPVCQMPSAATVALLCRHTQRFDDAVDPDDIHDRPERMSRRSIGADQRTIILMRFGKQVRNLKEKSVEYPH